MGSSPVVTKAEYLDAFETWFRVCAENAVVLDAEGPFREAWAQGGLPDAGPIDAFCQVLAPRMPRQIVWFAIGKSSFLARRLYGREPLRTVKCPRHQGRWSGIERCAYGCDMTGWLPAGAAVPDVLLTDDDPGPAELEPALVGDPTHEAGARVRVIADTRPAIAVGVVQEERWGHHGGCLVKHDDGPIYGWAWAELEPE